jgi:hypothetical protein
MHFISCFFDLTDADDDDDNESKMSAVAAVPTCDVQPPFQPSSTPAHLQHRFMVSVITVITVQIVHELVVKETTGTNLLIHFFS